MAPVPVTEHDGQIGPHPSFIQVAKPYIFEHTIQECITSLGVSQLKEDNMRLQGVSWVDSVRKALLLPVKTYNTASVYYHKFRMVHADHGYQYIDAAAAALFTACKIEDTLKRSRDILCASYNLKLTTAEQVSPDDPMFEVPSKAIAGLERLMLEASGFDFRNRHPQELLLKLAKHYRTDQCTVAKTAYNMSLDLYRTYAPLKQTTPTMAIACVELSGRLLEKNVPELEVGQGYNRWNITRSEVMETLLDLLDLYTQHRASTIVGQNHALELFIKIQITLNQEASTNKYPRYTKSAKPPQKVMTNGIKTTNGAKDLASTKSPVSPSDPSAKASPAMSPRAVAGSKGRAGVKDGTVRFMLDPERARDEKIVVSEYFHVEEEEYEVEVERRR